VPKAVRAAIAVRANNFWLTFGACICCTLHRVLHIILGRPHTLLGKPHTWSSAALNKSFCNNIRDLSMFSLQVWPCKWQLAHQSSWDASALAPGPGRVVECQQSSQQQCSHRYVHNLACAGQKLTHVARHHINQLTVPFCDCFSACIQSLTAMAVNVLVSHLHGADLLKNMPCRVAAPLCSSQSAHPLLSLPRCSHALQSKQGCCRT